MAYYSIKNNALSDAKDELDILKTKLEQTETEIQAISKNISYTVKKYLDIEGRLQNSQKDLSEIAKNVGYCSATLLAVQEEYIKGENKVLLDCVLETDKVLKETMSLFEDFPNSIGGTDMKWEGLGQKALGKFGITGSLAAAIWKGESNNWNFKSGIGFADKSLSSIASILEYGIDGKTSLLTTLFGVGKKTEASSVSARWSKEISKYGVKDKTLGGKITAFAKWGSVVFSSISNSVTNYEAYEKGEITKGQYYGRSIFGTTTDILGNMGATAVLGPLGFVAYWGIDKLVEGTTGKSIGEHIGDLAGVAIDWIDEVTKPGIDKLKSGWNNFKGKVKNTWNNLKSEVGNIWGFLTGSKGKGTRQGTYASWIGSW